jgi:hypothetical protein
LGFYGVTGVVGAGRATGADATKGVAVDFGTLTAGALSAVVHATNPTLRKAMTIKRKAGTTETMENLIDASHD